MRPDIVRNPITSKLIRSRGVQYALQFLIVLLYFFVIYAGLYGTQVPRLNLATVLVWTAWWTGIVFLILFLGKAWCYVCPWNALVTWVRRFTRVTPNLSWPRGFRNLYPALIFFAFITWLELGVGVTFNPRYTAYLLIALLVIALLFGLGYKKRVFCEHLCFVGAIQGMYSAVSPVELRSRSADVCRKCRTKDCVRGNDRGEGCPVTLYPGGMDRSTTSITCLECLRTCPYDNMGIFLRPFARELKEIKKPRADEAWFAVALLGLTIFHGITMFPSWKALSMDMGRAYYAFFTLSLTASIALPALALYLFSIATRRLVGGRDVAVKRIFTGFAYAFIPLALFYHLSHNTMHLVMEGGAVLPVVSDPLGMGWNLFGTRSAHLAPLLSTASTRYLQTLFVLMGLLAGLFAAYHASRRMFGRSSRRGFLAMGLLILGVALLSLWLIQQPMTMRTMY